MSRGLPEARKSLVQSVLESIGEGMAYEQWKAGTAD